MSLIYSLQKKIGIISKNAQNPFFKSTYLDLNGLLDALKPLLEEFGMTIIQPLEVIDGETVLTTKLLYNKDKDFEVTEVLKSQIIIPSLTDPQKIGSCISYFRRYSIQSMLCIQAEDNDGEIGQHNPATAQPIKKVTF